MVGAETITDSDAKGAGLDADTPQQIPRRGWQQIAKRGWAEAKEDQVPLMAAGVAFYGFLAIFPALIAVVLLYGLIADPSTIADQVFSNADAIPVAVRDLIVEQLRSIASTRRVGASVGVVVALALALWSASGGVGNLVGAINSAYDEKEKRSFVLKRAVALGLTLGAIVFMIIMLGLVALLPIVFQAVERGPLWWLAQVVRWILIAALVAVALAILYRVAPDREPPKFRWVSVGAVVATALWLLASVGFSVYVSVAGNYAKTYGSLASIVILLFWLWIAAYAVLLGAEINAEAEEQTAKDTTTGPAKPIGERGAVKADSLPPGTTAPSMKIQLSSSEAATEPGSINPDHSLPDHPLPDHARDDGTPAVSESRTTPAAVTPATWAKLAAIVGLLVAVLLGIRRRRS